MKQHSSSPGPFTRCGIATYNHEYEAMQVTYDADGATHTIYILNAHDLPRNRHTMPVPVFAHGDEGFIKCGYAHRSLGSGRAFIITTTTSHGDLTIQFSALQRVIHRESKHVPVSRMNAPSL